MKRPNILFMHVDQMHWQAMSGYGNKYVKTPNMDRIAADGCSFRGAYTAMPQCCPARASWYTGRMSSETGVPANGCNILPELPDLGQWLTKYGNYKSVYAGKWHIPGRDVSKSFDLIYGTGKGEFSDAAIARACLGFLENYQGDPSTSSGQGKPFFLNAGFHNPHDCCYTAGANGGQGKFRFAGDIEKELPPLPDNWEKSKRARVAHWSKMDWRYYIYIYYRWVEMVDAEIGRLYDGLMNSRFADNTVVIFAADHGDGLGFHGNISKGYMEEEAWRVPTIIVAPGKPNKGKQDNEHLSIGVDMTATICDYAQVPMMPKMTIAKSLRPIAEGKNVTNWRDHVVGESFHGNQVAVRDAQYKTILYGDDRQTKVYDLKNDPLEKKNLASADAGKKVIKNHKQQLKEYLGKIELAKPAKKKKFHDNYLKYYEAVRKEA